MTSTLLQRLQAIASSTPENTAIIDGDRTISYQQLDTGVAAMGRYLAARFERGTSLALVLDNSIEYVISLYGCWHAGLVAVPLDANSKPREIIKVLLHADTRAILSSRNKEHAKLAARELEIAFIETTETIWAPESYKAIGDLPANDPTEAMSMESEPGSDDAMIIFTSGTSGDPKGVILTHRNLAANATSIILYLKLTTADKVLVVLPFHYSYGNSVLHTHLSVGASVILGASMMYPQQVTDQLRESQATAFSGVPSTFAMLLARTDFRRDPPNLRYITQAGGAMTRTLTRELRQSLRGTTELFIMYGQTEATARLTWLPPDRLDDKPGSVGLPVDGVSLTIASHTSPDYRQQRSGEVLAKGPNVMRGYWKNPEATAATVQNGWLHTGDLGYIDNDGFLYLAGRATEMIKSGAHRILPAEIEEVILALPWISEVAVCGVPDDLLGQTIAAFVSGDESPKRTRELLAHCRQSLSQHKVPKTVIWNTNLPKTASGKIKKWQLTKSYYSSNDTNHGRQENA